jgi:hypothetical protein
MIASSSSVFPCVLASTGAVPRTATLPLIAGPQSGAYCSASAGTVDEQVVDVEGSPMMIAVNPPK